MTVFKELYAYRQMIFSLTKKDLRGRYKGSALGFMWTFINPLLQLCIYTIVFSTIMRAGIKDFYMFLFVALVPWIFFSACLQRGSMVFIVDKELVKKIYFPRIVMPISYVTSAFVNMLLTFIVIFAVIIVTGYGINWRALFCLPVIMVIEYVLALGVALIASACTVYLRDLEHIFTIVAMAWMYLTPIVYSPDFVPEKFRFYFNLNPMTPIVEAFRDVLYYKRIPEFGTLMQAFGFGVVILVLGYLIFNKLQKGFAEEL